MSVIKLPHSVYIPKKSELFQQVQESSVGEASVNRNFCSKADRFAVIEASAGTGKTFALVELVLDLVLEQGIALKSILLVTFTEKATAELRLRLRTKLRDLLAVCEKDSESFQTIPEGPFWEIKTQGLEQIKAALLDFDSVPVYTIHGFCKRVLREFAFENRQLFEQELCDTNLLFTEVFRRFMRRELLSQNTAVSELFSLYVKHAEGNLDSLEKDIHYLLSRDGKFVPTLPGFESYLKEFTVHWKTLVAQDLNLRKQNSKEHPIRTVFNSTALNGNSSKKSFRNIELLLACLSEAHAGSPVSENLLSIFGLELDAVTNPKCNKVLKDGEQWLNPQEFPPAERSWITALVECEKLLQQNNFNGDTKTILKAWVTQQVLQVVRYEIQQLKLEQGLFDFDDLLRLVEEQVLPHTTETKDPTPLTKAVRKKYLCAIVDEFQDTDRRQWSIFRQLFLESTEQRLIVIGDPKQAIYSFRGADIFTYLQARTTFEKKTAQLPFSLKKNFRSTKNLLSGLNKVFCSDLWFPEEREILYQQVGCGKPELELKDETENRNAIHLLELLPQFSVSGKKIAAQKKLKKPLIAPEKLDLCSPLFAKKYFGKADFLQEVAVAMKQELNETEESAFLNVFLDEQTVNANRRFAEAIAQEIKMLLRHAESESSRPLWQDAEGERLLREQDVCILFRQSNEGEMLAKALRRQGIAFAFYKQKGLFFGREAQEILTLLDAVANPADHSRSAKLWLTRFFGADIQQFSKNFSWDSEFLHQLQQWNAMAEARRFRKLFDEVLLRTKLVERELLLGGDERSVTNYVHLFEVLNRQVMERHLDLSELILLLRRYIEAKEDPGENENLLRLESERNAVQLMTMHAAKGLEFPVVFLFGGLSANKKNTLQFYHDAAWEPVIDLLNKNVPAEHQWQIDAEQQRLLYVAVTRACGRLYLPFADYVFGNSGKRACKINGGYSLLNDQLSVIKAEISAGADNSEFSYSYVENSAPEKSVDISKIELEKLKKWNPPELPEVPEIIAEIKSNTQFFSRLRYKKRGFVVSSFSRMNRKKEEQEAGIEEQAAIGLLPVEIRSETDLGERRENDESNVRRLSENADLLPVTAEALEISKTDSISETYKDQLPGGMQTGNMLHELLELVDFNTVKTSSSPEDWLANTAVHRLLDSFRERYGRSLETLPRIAEIIWSTLRVPVRLGTTTSALVLELADSECFLRETDFCFPIPEGEGLDKEEQKYNVLNSLQTQDFGLEVAEKVEGWQVEKGFLRGSIDYVFEHQGLIYLLDWKSNLLTDYQQPTLEREVLRHYQLQLQIYTLATSYWFKLDCEEKYQQKFGGVLYIFLRGMPQKTGMFFKRPSWLELKDYENSLRHEQY
ncbi:MAG: UvrD-helicase domain-containing protein [SAR324 cluster bacterium]|nr:UvrD-helicase domain-containing protein [SAR324 cluster bacterium]